MGSLPVGKLLTGFGLGKCGHLGDRPIARDPGVSGAQEAPGGKPPRRQVGEMGARKITRQEKKSEMKASALFCYARRPTPAPCARSPWPVLPKDKEARFGGPWRVGGRGDPLASRLCNFSKDTENQSSRCMYLPTGSRRDGPSSEEPGVLFCAPD